jgi:hypothetical protein
VVAARPSLVLVILVITLAVLSMIGAVYFGGHGQTPLAMIGTVLFVGLGGLAFELARRRSL